MIRLIEAHDLELYAVNTGEFYKQHCLMASKGYSVAWWELWLRERVLPHYSREIEPITYDHETVANVARTLRDYYLQHNAEAQS